MEIQRVRLKKIRDDYAKEKGVKNWRELDFVYSGRIPMVHWNRVIDRYVSCIKKENIVELINGSEKIAFKLFQSPRGARFGDKRANEVRLNINDTFNKKQLNLLINHLIDLQAAIE